MGVAVNVALAVRQWAHHAVPSPRIHAVDSADALPARHTDTWAINQANSIT